MALPISDHEKLINRLLEPELETSERVEILGNIRSNYGETVGDLDHYTETVEKQKEEITQLNSTVGQLFREQGTKQTDPEPDPQSFSETVTLSSLGI